MPLVSEAKSGQEKWMRSKLLSVKERANFKMVYQKNDVFVAYLLIVRVSVHSKNLITSERKVLFPTYKIYHWEQVNTKKKRNCLCNTIDRTIVLIVNWVEDWHLRNVLRLRTTPANKFVAIVFKLLRSNEYLRKKKLHGPHHLSTTSKFETIEFLRCKQSQLNPPQ